MQNSDDFLVRPSPNGLNNIPLKLMVSIQGVRYTRVPFVRARTTYKSGVRVPCALAHGDTVPRSLSASIPGLRWPVLAALACHSTLSARKVRP